MPKSYLKRILFLVWLFFCNELFATTTYFKNWDTLILVGPLSKDKKLKYYVQPQLRLIDDKYKFQTFFTYVGMGYELKPEITMWLMNGFVYLRRVNGAYYREDILRQQLSWKLIDKDQIQFNSTTRLEERKLLSQKSRWAYRIRQMLELRLPFASWKNHSLVLFDEMFFGLNHPAWTNSHTLLDQNRAFIGIGTRLSKEMGFDVGYMNQYNRKTRESVSNILYCNLNISLM